jgi:hypothetical protein
LIKAQQAAIGFNSWKPHLGLSQIATAGGTGALVGASSTAGLVPAAAQFSPKMVMNQVRGVRGSIDILNAMRTKTKAAMQAGTNSSFLKDDAFWTNSTRAVASQMGKEAEYLEYLEETRAQQKAERQRRNPGQK